MRFVGENYSTLSQVPQTLGEESTSAQYYEVLPRETPCTSQLESAKAQLLSSKACARRFLTEGLRENGRSLYPYRIDSL